MATMDMKAKWSYVRYYWDYATSNPNSNIPIVQPAIQQRKDSCAFAAVSTHIGYNLRINYGTQVQQPMNLLPDGMLISHERWQDEALSVVVGGTVTKNLWSLLTDARLNGVPLWNGLKLRIDGQSFFGKPPDADLMRQRLKQLTLVAVFRVHQDYSPDGDEPYMGTGKWIEVKGVKMVHAVVIVGEYKNDTLFGNDPVEPLWIYQNSDGNPSLSYLGNGLNVVRHSVLEEAYCAETFGTSIQLKQQWVNAGQPFRHVSRVTPEVLCEPIQPNPPTP